LGVQHWESDNQLTPGSCLAHMMEDDTPGLSSIALRALQQLFLEQEAHLVSSLQDLFKDQEKRITTAVLAGLNDGPKVQLATATPASPLPLGRFSISPQLTKVHEVAPRVDLPNVPMHREEAQEEEDTKKVAVVGAISEEKDEPPTIEETENSQGQPKLLRKQVQPLQDYAEFHNTQLYHRRIGHEIYDTDTKFEVYQKKTRKFLDSSLFGKILAAIILLNCVSLGWQVDWGVQNYNLTEPVIFEVITTLFTIIFTAEFSTRCFAYGIYMFAWFNTEIGWNIFDCVLVVSSLIDEVMSRTSDGINVTALRVLRLARLLRILRVFRVVRYFTDLRVMVQGILLSAKTLVWAIALLMVLMFSVTVCICQLLRPYLASLDSDTEKAELTDSFGSMIVGIFTLFQAMSGGVDWGEVALKLNKVSWMLALLFCVYMAFALFCVLNVMTGVFVENASKMTSADEEMIMMEEVRARQDYVDTVSRLFADCDKDNSGAVEWEEFQECAADLRFQTCFKKLGIALDTEADLKNVFHMLDFQNNGSVSVEEFALGIQMFSGGAKSIDVARLMFEVTTIKKYMTDMYDVLIGPVAEEDKGVLGVTPTQRPSAMTAEVVARASVVHGKGAEGLQGVVPDGSTG